MIFKRKKVSVKEEISLKSIKKMEEVLATLKNKNRYFSKPYTYEEIEKILLKSKTVSVYFKFQGKKHILEHYVNNNTLIVINHYYFDTKQYDSLETIINEYKIKDKWNDVEIVIMLDENDNQVL